MRSQQEETLRKKKSRAKHQCPPRLSEIIEQVNRLIVNNYEGERELIIGYSKSISYYSHAVEQIEDFASFVENHKNTLQKSFNNYFQQLGFSAVKDIDLIVDTVMTQITSGNWEELGISLSEAAEFVTHWFDAFVNRNGIKALKNIKTAWTTVEENKENLHKIIEHFASTKKQKLKVNLNLVTVLSKIVIQDGKINVMLPEFFEIINGIDIERLRICKICSRIFWAKRRDSETCSLQCANNLRVQRHRTSNHTKVKKMKKELANEKQILEKLQLNLSHKNSLITQQREYVHRLTEKIKKEETNVTI